MHHVSKHVKGQQAGKTPCAGQWSIKSPITDKETLTFMFTQADGSDFSIHLSWIFCTDSKGLSMRLQADRRRMRKYGVRHCVSVLSGIHHAHHNNNYLQMGSRPGSLDAESLVWGLVSVWVCVTLVAERAEAFTQHWDRYSLGEVNIHLSLSMLVDATQGSPWGVIRERSEAEVLISLKNWKCLSVLCRSRVYSVGTIKKPRICLTLPW